MKMIRSSQRVTEIDRVLRTYGPSDGLDKCADILKEPYNYLFNRAKMLRIPMADKKGPAPFEKLQADNGRLKRENEKWKGLFYQIREENIRLIKELRLLRGRL